MPRLPREVGPPPAGLRNCPVSCRVQRADCSSQEQLTSLSIIHHFAGSTKNHPGTVDKRVECQSHCNCNAGTEGTVES